MSTPDASQNEANQELPETALDQISGGQSAIPNSDIEERGGLNIGASVNPDCSRTVILTDSSR